MTPLRHWLKPSLASLFARYFVTAMVAQLIIIIGFGFVVTKLYEGNDKEDQRRFMNGTVTLLRQELSHHPRDEWPQVVASLAGDFSYPIALAPASSSELTPTERQRLTGGHAVLDYDSMRLYAPLAGDSRLLVLGPLTSTGSDGSWITEDIEMLLLWILLAGTTLGTMIYFGLRPLWQDLLALRQMAEVFAEGDFSARAEPASSRLLAPLPTAFNGMAERLEKQMETRQALSHAIAHEIRTPIARLRFGLTMLEEEEDPETWRGYREGMERDMKELEELITASMELTKLNRGEVPLHWETVDLYHWFDDLIHLVTPLKPAHLTLTLDCIHEQGAFDRRLMYIASRNLLLNAFKYAKSRVQLTVSFAEDQLLVEVEDDGCGIPEEDRDKVFEPFRRLDRSRDRATGGYGLGLSFVRLIAIHHGGGVAVDGSKLGGARFSMRTAREKPVIAP